MMKRMLCLILVCLLLLCACEQKDPEPVGESVPNPYPELSEPPLAGSRVPTVDLSMYTLETEAIFVGTVVSEPIHGYVYIDPETKRRVAEKTGKVYFGDFKLIRVDQPISGELQAGDEIYMCAFEEGSDGKNSYPSMLPGERYVFFVDFRSLLGYWMPHVGWDGLFYITEEDRVFPADVKTSVLKQYNNMRLDDFLDVVREKSKMTKEEVYALIDQHWSHG